MWSNINNKKNDDDDEDKQRTTIGKCITTFSDFIKLNSFKCVDHLYMANVGIMVVIAVYFFLVIFL